MGGLFTKQRPLGRLAGRQQLIRGSDTPWFTQLCQLRCQKMLIVGERSLPYADSDLVQAQGIPVGIVPMPDTRWRGKIRRGWRSLSPAIVKRRWASEGKLAGLGLDRYPAQLGEFRDPGPAAKAAIAGRLCSRQTAFVASSCTVGPLIWQIPVCRRCATFHALALSRL